MLKRPVVDVIEFDPQVAPNLAAERSGGRRGTTETVAELPFVPHQRTPLPDAGPYNWYQAHEGDYIVVVANRWFRTAG